jgi:hypothetical protein
MNKSHLYALLGAFVFTQGIIATSVNAAPILDQEQPQFFTLFERGGIALGGNSEQKLAQVVTAGITGDLVKVATVLACSASSPSPFNVVLEIRGVTTDGSGRRVPDNLVVKTSQVIPDTEFPVAPNIDFVEVTLAVPVSVVVGDEFAIVWTAPSTTFCVTAQTPSGDLYGGGDGYFDSRPNVPGVWVPLSLSGFNDLAFKTFVEPTPVVLVITIDIKPGSDPNAINVRSKGNAAESVRYRLEDVDDDGDWDLALKFNTQETGIACGDTETTLTGETFNGQGITGTDSIKTVGCKKPKTKKKKHKKK